MVLTNYFWDLPIEDTFNAPVNLIIMTHDMDG